MAFDLRLGATAAAVRTSLLRPWIVPFVVVLSATLSTQPLGAAADDSAVVTIDPSRLFVEIETESSEVTCTYSTLANSGVSVGYVWLDSNQLPLNTSTDSRIFYNATTGTLVLNHAEVNDSGEYACLAVLGGDVNGTCNWTDWADCPNATLTYKVYVMPDYTTEGIIIGVINAVLLVIFIACLIRSAIADRRRLRKYGRKM